MAWRIQESDITLTQDGMPLCSGNADRIALYVTNQTGADGWISTRAPPITSNTGLDVAHGKTIRLVWSQDGGIVKEAFFGYFPNKVGFVTIIEVYFYPDG